MHCFKPFLFFLFFSPFFISAQIPTLVLPIGHTEPINFVSFSSDGDKIATASFDNTLKIWETASGRLLKDFQIDSNTAFLYNWKKMIVANNYTVKIRDGQTGNEITSFTDPGKRKISSLVLSADGKRLMTVSSYVNNNIQAINIWDITAKPVLVDGVTNDNVNNGIGAVFNVVVSNDLTKIAIANKQQIIIRDFNSNNLIAEFKTPLNTGASAMLFSPNGNFIYTIRDSVVKCWNAATGFQTSFMIKAGNRVNALLLNKSGDRIITTNGEGIINLWDSSGKKIADITDQKQLLSVSGNDYLITESVSNEKRVWQMSDGIFVSRPSKVKPTDKNKKGLVSLSSDNELFVTVDKNEAAIYETQNGRLFSELKGHNLKILAHRVWTNGEKISVFYDDNTCRIWDIKKGILEIAFKVDILVKNAIISPDGLKLAVLSSDTTKIWDIGSGKLLAAIARKIDKLIFSPYEGIFLLHEESKAADRVTIWNLESNTEVKTVNQFPGVFCADGSVMASSVKSTIDNNNINLWITESGALIRKLEAANTLVFSGDASMFATASAQKDSFIRIDSLDNVSDTLNHSAFVIKDTSGCLLKPIVFSKGARKIAVQLLNCNDIIQIWDVVTRKPLCRLNGLYSSIKFSPDGEKIAAVKNDQSVILFDANSGNQLNTLKGYTSAVFGQLSREMDPTKSKKEDDFLSFLPDGSIVTKMYDNTINLWDENGKFLYRFFAVDSLDYLAVDADGRYDGTPGARDLLYYVCGDEVIQLEQIKKVSWEVGLAEKIMGKSAPRSFLTKKLSELSICGITPVITLLKQSDSLLVFNVLKRAGGLSELIVFVNGKGGVDTIDIAGLDFKNNEAKVEINTGKYADYFVAGAENSIFLRAKTTDRLITSRGVEISQSGKPGNSSDTKLFAIIIGINDYDGTSLNLEYCVKDANAIEEVISKSTKELLNVQGKKDNVVIYKLVSGKGNLTPTKENIIRTFEKVKAEAKPNDILIVFLAGHGTIYPAGSDKLYCLTSEANSFNEVADPEKRKIMSINGDELIGWFKSIYAKRQIMILDVCNSGAIVSNISKADSKFEAGTSRQESAIDNLNKESGVYVLSGAAGGTLANEVVPLKQGLLTYSILYGMKNGSALRDNHFLNIKELIYGSVSNLKMISKDFGFQQDPYYNFPLGGGTYDIGIVDKKIQEEIKLESSKPIMVKCFISNKSDSADFGDNVLSDMLDNKLAEMNKDVNSNLSFLFLPGFKLNKMLSTYKITGDYTIQDDAIILNYRLIEMNSKNTIKKTFPPITGMSDKPEKIIAEVIKQVDLFIEKGLKK